MLCPHLPAILLQGINGVHIKAIIFLLLPSQLLEPSFCLHLQDGAARCHDDRTLDVGSGAILQLDSLECARLVTLCKRKRSGKVLEKIQLEKSSV